MLVDNFGLFFRTTWLLILISVPISTLSLIINPENHKDDRLNYLIALISQLVLTIILPIVFCLLTAIFAVMWHRLILLGERSSNLYFWRFKRREWLFFLWEFLPYLAITIFLLYILRNHYDLFTNKTTTYTVGLILFYSLQYLFLRINLILPAIAVENENISILVS